MSPISAARRAEWTRRLARGLVSAGQVAEPILAAVVDEAIGADVPLADLVIGRGLAPSVTVVNILGQLARLPAIDLHAERPASAASRLLPSLLAQDHRAVALRVVGAKAVVAFAEPPDPADVRSLSALIGHELVPVLGDPLVIDALLGRRPASASSMTTSSAIGGLGPGVAVAGAPVQVTAIAGGAEDPAGVPGNGSSTVPADQFRNGAATVVSGRPGNGSSAPTDGFANGAATIPRHASTGTSPVPMAVATPGGAVPAAAAVPLPAELQGAGGPAWLAGDGAEELPLHVDDLLRYVVSVGASDLHLAANMPPTIRLHGALRPMEEVGQLDQQELRELLYGVLPQSQRERFEAEHELDTSHTIAGVGRFRVNICLQRETLAAALRPIPYEIPDFDTLGLPDSVRNFTDLRRGLVLVTGPTGSGKSTTLASLIDIINRSKPHHIITVEDPIEFLHTNKRSIITQREVGSDTTSFAEALRRALRQDPDVILVGELRDLETISTALTAAETGHLVFATLHTQDAPSTVDRIIDVFPPSQQEQIRIQLGSSLQGIVTQQLVPTVDGKGRCVASEVLVCTPAIQNLIRAAKTHQVYSLMQTGSQHGMQTMDQCLAQLVRQRKVTEALAIDRCRNEEDFRNHLHGK